MYDEIRKQLRGTVKLYRKGTGISKCQVCNSDIWFFLDDNNQVTSAQHGDDPDNSVVLNLELSPLMRTKEFVNWLRNMH